MDRRSRRLHRFLVSSPVVLLIAISAVGHLRKPAHVGAAGTPEYDRRVLAYRDRVVAVQSLPRSEKASKLASLTAEADKWVDGYRSGTLLPLQPAAYEDHLREGVRGEVLTAGLRLGSQLTYQAGQALEQKSYAKAASTSVLAAETILGLREFELQAYLQCVYSARRSLTGAQGAWPFLSKAERDALRPRIEAMRLTAQEPETLLRLDEHLLNDYINRQGRSNTTSAIDAVALAKADEQQQRAVDKGTRHLNEVIDGIIGPVAEASRQAE
ncbi:hypothetical protein EON82_04935 [bacterium]|nr:MAG: hypothetical protein EON82_04935 [bacterium]